MGKDGGPIYIFLIISHCDVIKLQYKKNDTEYTNIIHINISIKDQSF